MERPKEYSVQEVAQRLKSDTPPKLLDVREPGEWNLVHLEGAELFTEDLLDAMLNEWPKDTSIVCYCHHGVRSLNAAFYLQQQGFTDVSSMRGGIEAWARELDPSLPRY